MARTKSAAAHQKAIEAATALFSERGIEGTSMDAIAASAGVSKATIYKHWADKEALLLEVMEEIVGLKQRPAFDSGNTRADLLAALTFRPEQNAALMGRMMPHFIAYAAHNREFGDLWRSRAIDPPRREVFRLLRRGIQKGELAKMDVEIAATLLLGPLLYWHIFLRAKNDNPTPIAKAAIESFWRAFGRSLVSCKVGSL